MATSKRRRSCGLVGLFLGLVWLGWASSASAQSAVETFDADLGGWSTTFGNHENGFDFDWSDTANAGGSAGEVGGLFVRTNQPTGDLSMPRILDTASFAAPLTLNQPLSASGMMYLDDVSDTAGLDVHIGYFNENNPMNERLIIRISPNSGNVWRFRTAANTGQGTRVDAGTQFDSVPLEFHLDWVPSGLDNGTGTLTGSVSDGVTTLVLDSPFVGANTATLDSFGVWANSASSTNPSQQQRMFFDDVTYTVPEPSSMSLGMVALGSVLLLGRVYVSPALRALHSSQPRRPQNQG
jgi:hypothetical protein